MSATLKLTHKAIGAEVRRGAYDVIVDGERVGSVEMNGTIEIPVKPGRHTLQVRNGRNSSGIQPFDAAEGEIVAFRCTGKRFLPVFLASFVVPRLALKLVRELVGVAVVALTRMSTRYLQLARASLARAIRYAEAHDLVGRNLVHPDRWCQGPGRPSKPVPYLGTVPGAARVPGSRG